MFGLSRFRRLSSQSVSLSTDPTSSVKSTGAVAANSPIYRRLSSSSKTSAERMVVRQLCILTGASPSFALQGNIGRRRMFFGVNVSFGSAVGRSNVDESCFNDEQECGKRHATPICVFHRLRPNEAVDCAHLGRAGIYCPPGTGNFSPKPEANRNCQFLGPAGHFCTAASP
jgi:hypothetical protein